MRRTELAEQLVAARTRNERKRLLREKAHLADLRLAFQIKEICYAHWATEPSIARRASVVLKELADAVQSPEVLSIALWVEGIAHITLGKLDDAINILDRSARGFRKLSKNYEAAQTGVAKLMALAFLGRYDAAIRTGKRSLEVFEAEGDIFGSGRVELNLANLYSKLEMHSVSEKYGLSARRRFVRCGSTKWKIMAENGLAITYASLGDFAAARGYYEQALAAARQAKMLVTEAEIEASLGDLESMTGNFAEAVRHLERSRQKFLSIDVQHNSAVADLEIAASYLQLNLIAEAVVILDRTAPSLRKLKLKPEEARARVLLGRAMARTGRGNAAVRQFQIAEALFETIENRIGLALTRLEHAQVELRQGRVEEAATMLRLAETSLRSTENPRHKLLARWTRAELASQRKKPWQAQRLLREILAEAERVSSSELVISASNALGEIALANGDIRSAKGYFDRAVTLLDKTSGTLISDEFRVAFSGLAARPFENLTKILLAEGLIREAFAVTERSKAQALSDTIRGDRSRVASNGPIGLSKRAEELREELNWVYSRQARYADASRSTLDRRRRRLERELASIARQIDSLAGSRKAREQGVYSLDVDKLIAVCRRKKAAIIEFCQIDASFSAFVISGEGIRVVADLASDTEVTKWLDQLMFQFASFRYGRSLPTAVEDPLKRKTDSALKYLGSKLLGRIASLEEFDEIVIVPAGVLNRVPFHALRNDSGYLIEQTEISYAPSASAWYSLRRRSRPQHANTLIVGSADKAIPFVLEELEAVAEQTPAPEVLSGSDATFGAFMNLVAEYDLVHIACHGEFRPDNPMYSSIHLFDGWVTANDICSKRLKADLVTLSACETGISKVAAGDEIMGLARGFFSAGANTLVLSLWAVNDAATRELMASFYGYLRDQSPGQALRAAQLEMIAAGRHPYFWAPFVKIGK